MKHKSVGRTRRVKRTMGFSGSISTALMLQFCGSVVTSDAGLLPYRELDDVLGLTVIAGNSLADARTGKNGRHALVGLLRQSVFSRFQSPRRIRGRERRRTPAS